MSDKKQLKKISSELKKAVKMHTSQYKRLDNMAEGPSMLGVIPNVAGNLKQNLRTQGIAENLFQGQALAEQMQARRIDKPIMPPAPDPTAPLYLKKVVKEQPKALIRAPYMERTPEVAIEPTKKIYKEMTERVVREVPREMTGYQRELMKEPTRQIMPRPVRVAEFKTEINMVADPKKYKKGELIDETDHEKSTYRSSNEGIITGKRYNVENISDIQEDKKGQFMTTLGEGEYFGGERPTSSRVTNYDQGRNVLRDTLRPVKGNVFRRTFLPKK